MNRGAVVLAALTVALPALAWAATRTERVEFAKGKTVAQIKGTIRDDATVDYLVAAQAGQTLAITLGSNQANNHFNVTAPGTGTAMFVGSVLGAAFKAKLPLSGDYTVQVYLERGAGKKSETATYTLTVEMSKP